MQDDRAQLEAKAREARGMEKHHLQLASEAAIESENLNGEMRLIAEQDIEVNLQIARDYGEFAEKLEGVLSQPGRIILPRV